MPSPETRDIINDEDDYISYHGSSGLLRVVRKPHPETWRDEALDIKLDLLERLGSKYDKRVTPAVTFKKR